MNILTFDIEEWYLEKALHGDHKEKYQEFDQYLDQILCLLDERHIQATFFCVGGMASEFPEVIRRIVSKGHEIGCHSFNHTWLDKLSKKDVSMDTHKSVDALEQCVGKKIKSYRAPAFSIGESNKWAFEILAECGIERDASIYPAARDFGGFSSFGSNKPIKVGVGGGKLKEFPVCTAIILGREMAFSGGGYFRFFPLWMVERLMANRDYNMCYFHIGDLIVESANVPTREEYENYYKEKGTFVNRYKRYLKSNIGKKGAFEKMKSLIQHHDFVSVEQADAIIDWNKAGMVDLNGFNEERGDGYLFHA